MPTCLTRIIGIGNPLMGDDGAGIRAVELLRHESLPPGVELVDGGCGGLSLLPLIESCQRLIIIDAADFGATAGSIKTLGNSQLNQLPEPLFQQTSHCLGLAEVLATAKKFGTLPTLTLVLLQVEFCQPHFGLSINATSALPLLVQKILALLR